MCANEKEQEAITQLLTYWNREVPVHHLGEGVRPYELLAFTDESPRVFVASFEHAMQPLPHPDELDAMMLSIELHTMIAPADIAQQCLKRGYEWSTTADEPGFFARHGGIVDIFSPLMTTPLRIECNEARVESIVVIDPATKKKVRDLNRIDIPPMKLNASHRANLFTYLEKGVKPLLILDAPDELAERVADWDSIQPRIAPCMKIIWETFQTRQRDVRFDYHRAPLYHNRLKTFSEDVKKHHAKGVDIIIASKNTDELKELMKARAPQVPVTWLDSPPAVFTGFKSDTDKCIILSDLEIFGFAEQDTAMPKSIENAFIMEMRPGDYVVHIDHGVARFRGMTRNVIDGIAKEYFVLEYAEGDKLYVPVETAEKINKYIGLAHPKLHRLSGGQWYQVTRKIKEEAKLLAQQLLKLYARRNTARAHAFGEKTGQEVTLEQSFEFEETPDQLRAIAEVEKDLSKTRPMDRLICGDVGFGKTEVAIRAAFKAVMGGMQVALLSPTTILTQQHYDTFRERLQDLPVNVGILSRFVSEKEERQTIAALKTGGVDIVIGTHRLLSPDIAFKNLGLIIIDEEQRFGVSDKERLKSLRTQAHVLTLTATPIPRTLNIALSGIRDVSIIETPPEGRLPIETIIERHDTNVIVKAIRTELARKGQIYYLYNNVETIQFAAQELNKLIPEAKIGIAHGKLSEKLLAQAMRDFDTGVTNILVCSTIIENGLDLPNVNTLIVEQATKFGLAQLYQLRGRIGRGLRQAYAYFLYDRKKLTGMAKRRLQALLEAKELGSGFQLALRDLEIRGTGNILGKEQHGKVSAIGLAMYTRLLAQAVQELKTGAIETIRDVTIDLPVEIGIPKTFMPSETERLVMYQKLANLSHPEELQTFKKRVTYRQKIPLAMQHLFDVLEIKLLAQKTDITTIDTITMPGPGEIKHRRLVIHFAHHLDIKKLGLVLEENSKWEFTQNQIKIDLEHLGEHWLDELKAVMRIWRIENGTAVQPGEASEKKEGKQKNP